MQQVLDLAKDIARVPSKDDGESHHEVPDVYFLENTHQRRSKVQCLYQVGLFGDDMSKVGIGLVINGQCKVCRGKRCIHTRRVDEYLGTSSGTVSSHNAGERCLSCQFYSVEMTCSSSV